jgi:uncharacterized membrane protein
MAIETLIKEWAGKGLINDSQASQILEYERAKPRANWVLRGFLSLGVLVLGIGVISLVAANWEAISGWAKLIGNFIILGGVAALAFNYFRKNQQLGADITGLFFALLCLGSIALVAQVFHTGGHLYEAFFFWNLITLPLILFSELKLSSFLWTLALFVSFEFWCIDQKTFSGDYWYSNIFYLWALMPFISDALANLTGHLLGLRNFSFSFRFAYLYTAINFIVFFNVLPYDHHFITPPSTLFFALVAGSLLVSIFSLRWSGLSLRIQAFRIGVLIALGIIVYLGIKVPLTAFRAAELTLLFCLVSALEAGVRKQKGLFNFWTIAVGLRFLILYFEALRGLAITGLGLIVSGFVIIGTALLWNKYRAWLFKKAEEWIA